MEGTACSWIVRLNIVKMFSLPKLVYSQCNSNQNLIFFVETVYFIWKFIWKCKAPNIAKTILKIEVQSWRVNTIHNFKCNFKTYYTAILIKSVVLA